MLWAWSSASSWQAIFPTGSAGRRIIAPAVLLNVLSALIFIAWPDLPGLLLARFISGLGIGMLTPPATAHMTELHTTARPAADSRRAEVISTAANIGGLGLGPLVTGILAEIWARAAVHPVPGVRVPAGAGTAPDCRRPRNLQGRCGNLGLPAAAGRGALRRAWSVRAAAMMAFVGFAMCGFFTSLAPSFVSGQLGITSHVVAGVVVFLVFAASAAFQVLSSRWRRTVQFAVGQILLVAGLVLVSLSIPVSSLPLLIAGGLVAGSGVGVTFKSVVGTVISIAPSETRGEALAGLFLAAYVGASRPTAGVDHAEACADTVDADFRGRNADPDCHQHPDPRPYIPVGPSPSGRR